MSYGKLGPWWVSSIDVDIKDVVETEINTQATFVSKNGQWNVFELDTKTA